MAGLRNGLPLRALVSGAGLLAAIAFAFLALHWGSAPGHGHYGDTVRWFGFGLAWCCVLGAMLALFGCPFLSAVLAAYGESVDSGQPLARMQGEQMLALQRDYIQAQAQAEVASENRRRDEALRGKRT